MPAQDVERVRRLFFRAGLPVCVKLSPAQRKALFDAMRLDKKVSAGEIKFVLARAIGRVEFGKSVPDALVQQILDVVEG
jgi:3-dehydroquinate synthase